MSDDLPPQAGNTATQIVLKSTPGKASLTRRCSIPGMNTKQQSLERTKLTQLRAGAGAVVTNVMRTPDNHFVVRRLAELGIRPGAQLTAGQKTPGGGRIVGVAGAQLALDRATLHMLEVRPA